MMKKGVLHLDDDGSIISHKYSLTLTEDTDVWITIQPKPMHPDAGMFCLSNILRMRVAGWLVRSITSRDGLSG